jgi:hypothetical protein
MMQSLGTLLWLMHRARQMRPLFLVITLAAAIAPTIASAEEHVVEISGALALLNEPRVATESIVLIPGGDGMLGIQHDGSFSRGKENQLVRTRKAYLEHGIATLTVDYDVSIPQAIAYMRKLTNVVAIVATSRGAFRVAGGLSRNPDAVVLTAAMLDEVKDQIGVPDRLPSTLLVHHRQDKCRLSPPDAVDRFKSWAPLRVEVAWMDGGIDAGRPCGAHSHHGFNGLDDRVVATIAAFLARRGKGN